MYLHLAALVYCDGMLLDRPSVKVRNVIAAKRHRWTNWIGKTLENDNQHTGEIKILKELRAFCGYYPKPQCYMCGKACHTLKLEQGIRLPMAGIQIFAEPNTTTTFTMLSSFSAKKRCIGKSNSTSEKRRCRTDKTRGLQTFLSEGHMR